MTTTIVFRFTDVMSDNHLNRIFHAMNSATGTTFSIDGWEMEERVDVISTWNVTARVEPHEVANVIAAIGEHNATFLSHAHPNFERFNALMDKYNIHAFKMYTNGVAVSFYDANLNALDDDVEEQYIDGELTVLDELLPDLFPDPSNDVCNALHTNNEWTVAMEKVAGDEDNENPQLDECDMYVSRVG